ncbi:MAG: hypothetical protein UMU76_08055 [Prosthecochloris sp.]|nr:hypothetical protein [Prosthecochloris sp.]
MKLGYSILLGEYIKAQYLDYKDCEFFQVVCPSCKEPVFKVVRNHDGEELNYFSHYKKDNSYVSECELRVQSINSDKIKKNNSESREQLLKHFLSVLQEVIIESEFHDPSPNKQNTRKLFSKINNSDALKAIRKTVFEYSVQQISVTDDDELNLFLDGCIEDIESVSGSFFDTQFSINKQKQIAIDVWRHLLTPNAKSNYDFVFNHAFVHFARRLEIASETAGLREWEDYLYAQIIKLISASKNKGSKIINNLRNYQLFPPHTAYPSNLMIKMYSEITHEMLGCLLRLPYFDLIKK